MNEDMKQINSGLTPDYSKMRKRCKEITNILEQVLAPSDSSMQRDGER